MIHNNHPTWRAIHLKDDESASYLNKMFRSGWSMVPVGIDDIEWLMMSVPTETPKRIRPPDLVLEVSEMASWPMFVVVLRKDRARDRFRAVIKHRDESGYFTAGTSSGLASNEWQPIIFFALENGSACEIFARRTVKP